MQRVAAASLCAAALLGACAQEVRPARDLPPPPAPLLRTPPSMMSVGASYDCGVFPGVSFRSSAAPYDVNLQIDVGIDGRVAAADILGSSGSRTLDDDVLRAVSAWRFRPAIRQGKPSQDRVLLELTFDGPGGRLEFRPTSPMFFAGQRWPLKEQACPTG
jgi:TonB family protein